jgi:hypothetical protein
MLETAIWMLPHLLAAGFVLWLAASVGGLLGQLLLVLLYVHGSLVGHLLVDRQVRADG